MKQRTGKTDPAELQSYKWFRKGYKEYRPDAGLNENLKTNLSSYQIIIIGGTWCPDTQRMLPHFYKIIDQAGYPRENATLYMVDTSKKSPENIAEKYQVKAVPAFILLKHGQEKGRITEHERNTLEEDLMDLVK
ncbi:MAG: thioredoxin family protein [Cytophagaceae bacterium]